MKNLDRRLDKLENRFGVGRNASSLRLFVSDGMERALDEDTCVKILEETGFLPSAGVGVVNLFKIPVGLNAEETAKFVRENGAVICGSPLPKILIRPQNDEDNHQATTKTGVINPSSGCQRG